MKLALLSDVHANRRALQACLAHARAAGADEFALLGDLVGYGAEPAEVVDAVMQLAATGAAVLRGNHEEAVLAPASEPRSAGQASAAWTRTQLNDGQRRFLGELPLTVTLHGALLVHASAQAPHRWSYVDRPEQAQRCLQAAAQQGLQHVLCGHVHEQRLFYRGGAAALIAFEPTPGVPVSVSAHRAWVATVGSVGQPRDGDPRAMYALFDVAQHRLTFHRVAYDHRAAAAAVRHAGLPPDFADRLEQGR